MDWLEKRVTGDWITIRENLTTPNRFRTMMKIEDGPLSNWVVNLKQATLEGTVEVKRKSASAVFSFLSKLTRQTPSQPELLSVEGDIRHLLYIEAVQNLHTTGQIKPAKEEAPAVNGAKKLPVQEIYADLQTRIAANPEVGKNPQVRNIAMELQLYKKEHQQFSDMSPTVPDDRAPQFFMNFKKRIDGITDTINAQYQEFLGQETRDQAVAQTLQEEQLLVNPELSKLLLTQAQELSRVRSTLLFALDEGYKFRDPLLKLFAKREQFLALLDQELRMFDARMGGATGHPLAVRTARAMAAYLEGQIKLNR